MSRSKKHAKEPMEWKMPPNVRHLRKHYSKEETGGIPPPPPDLRMRRVAKRCDECGITLDVVVALTDEQEEMINAEWNKIHG